MQNLLMPQRHRCAAPWAWQLESCEAATLKAEARPRWLRVEDGMVWVTALEAGPHGADLWLEAGESLELPAGSAWVIQAWPSARLSLAVQAPAVSARAGAWADWRGWLASRLHASPGQVGWGAPAR